MAAVITKSVCAPFDRIRLLYQVQGMFNGQEDRASGKIPHSQKCSAAAAVRRVKYGGLVHTAQTIYREEGIVGFWRGNGANIIRGAMVYAMKFGTNDWLKEKMLARQIRNVSMQKKDLAYDRDALVRGVSKNSPSATPDAQQLGTLALMKAGGLAGLAQKAVSYPLDLVTVRIALGVNTSTLGHGKKTYDSILGCITRIKNTEGYVGFYKGFAPTLLTGVPYVMLQMTFFEVIKRRCSPTRTQPRESDASPGVLRLLLTSGFAGSLAGVAAQSLVFPGDTVRKRMMSNGIDGRPRIYRSSWDCAVKIFQREGLLGFYSGVLPLCLRAIPSGAVQFASYELCKLVMSRPN